MHVETTDNGWIVRIDRGEDVVDSLLAFVRGRDIPSGEIRGIGAIEDVELGYYDVANQRYHRTSFPGSMELLSFVGNIGWNDGEPVVHAHVVVAGQDMVARGGHMFQGIVSATAEFYVTPTAVRVQRKLDPEVGLKLMVFGNEAE